MSEIDTSTEAIAEMSRKLRSQDPADLPWRMEVADMHDAIAAERDAAASAQMEAVENWTRAELRRVDAERERDALRAEVERLRVLLRNAREWNWIDFEENRDNEEYLVCVPTLVKLNADIDAALNGGANG